MGSFVMFSGCRVSGEGNDFKSYNNDILSLLYHSRRRFVDSVRRERTLAAAVLLWYPYGKERAGGVKNEG